MKLLHHSTTTTRCSTMLRHTARVQMTPPHGAEPHSITQHHAWHRRNWTTPSLGNEVGSDSWWNWPFSSPDMFTAPQPAGNTDLSSHTRPILGSMLCPKVFRKYISWYATFMCSFIQTPQSFERRQFLLFGRKTGYPGTGRQSEISSALNSSTTDVVQPSQNADHSQHLKWHSIVFTALVVKAVQVDCSE